jgi:hypothetical protein
VKVDFFIAGVQKGGTTALDDYLRSHPSIQMGRTKELHFFDDEALDWNAPDYAGLHSAFEWANDEAIRGEATPIYTYWPNALERLQRYNPAARLVVCLRHPTFRAWSHWRMETKRNAETLPFAAAIEWPARERVRSAPSGVHRVFSYIERGFYADQVVRILRLFSRDQVLFLRSDRLWSDPQQALESVQKHLSVPPSLKPERRYIVPIDSSELGSIPAASRERLDTLFRQDIQATAALIDMELSDWLRPDYAEGMGPEA